MISNIFLFFLFKGTDIYSFSVKEGILPQKPSLTHEGLFYKYYFETGEEQEKIFSISSALAITQDPFHHQKEYYACIGLNSKFDGDGLKKFNARPGLNFVIVLDISGSMDSQMTSQNRRNPNPNPNGTIAAEQDNEDDVNGSKLDVAKKNILSLIEHLIPTDMFSLITFDTVSYFLFFFLVFFFLSQFIFQF